MTFSRGFMRNLCHRCTKHLFDRMELELGQISRSVPCTLHPASLPALLRQIIIPADAACAVSLKNIGTVNGPGAFIVPFGE